MAAKNNERDEAICQRYQKDGILVSTIADEYGLTSQRVRQILAEHAIQLRDDRSNGEGLEEFLGVNLSDEDKIELRREAEAQGISAAKLTRSWIKDQLRRLKEARASSSISPAQ